MSILSFSSPANVYSVNKAEMEAMRFSLQEARRLNLQNILVEGDSLGSNRWAPWSFADIVEEVSDIGNALVASYSHVKRSANRAANLLGKELIAKTWL